MPSEPHKNAASQLDATDYIILTELAADGRMTNADLASTIGLSPSATLRRVRSLEEAGVIEGYAARLNPGAMGRETTVFVEIALSGQSAGELDAFEAAIIDCPGVLSCHLMAGNFDYLVQLVCADVPDYGRIHRDHLSQIAGVDRIRSSFALRAVEAGAVLKAKRAPRH